MTGLKVSLLLLSMSAVLGMTFGQQLSHEERCQVLEGNGIRVDQCDSSKLLACRDGRCLCSDPVNQIYTYRSERIVDRSRRSPGKKGGGFKKVAAGAVAGVATYHVAKTVSKGFSTTPPPPKYKKVYSCYSRIGGQCAIHYNNWESVSTTTAAPASSSTTPETSINGTTEATHDNSTSTTSTTTVAPSASALVDITKIPRCVENAVCKPSSPAPAGNSTSSFLQKVDFDPRLGTCECDSGYKRTTRDICVKVSGADKTVGASVAVILATLIVNKMLIF